MNPQISRGFLVLLLNRTDRERLYLYERSLPRGRYLTAGEICRLFELQPVSPGLGQVDMMKRLWVVFCRAKDKDQTNLEDQGTARAWSEYVIANYHDPVSVSQ